MHLLEMEAMIKLACGTYQTSSSRYLKEATDTGSSKKSRTPTKAAQEATGNGVHSFF